MSVRPREARGPAECPPRGLFRAGGGISLLCATSLLSLENFQRGGNCVVARAGVLDRAVRGDCLRQHPALGQSQNRVADSACLDGARILPQRTLLFEIFVAERRVCAAVWQLVVWNVWDRFLG